MGTRTDRFDAFQQHHSWLGLPVAVIYKYVDDQGNYLAALVTYYGFLSMFPLLLLAATILGYVLHGDAGLQHRVLSSALVDFPIIGNQLQEDVHGYSGSSLAVVVGVVVGLYGALGVAQAGQNAMNIVWGVPRNRRPNPLSARLRSLRVLTVLGAGVLATTALSVLATTAQSFLGPLQLGVVARIVVIGLSAVLDIALFMVAFRVLTTEELSLRDVAVGAVIAGVAWQVLQDAGGWYLGRKLGRSSQVYGTFAVVFGLLAWIYLEAVVVVWCAELNAVLRRRLWPRSLLTPFTDDVHLTRPDRRAYASYAKAQRFKGFERISVDFNGPTDEADAVTHEPGGGPAEADPVPGLDEPPGPAEPGPTRRGIDPDPVDVDGTA